MTKTAHALTATRDTYRAFDVTMQDLFAFIEAPPLSSGGDA